MGAGEEQNTAAGNEGNVDATNGEMVTYIYATTDSNGTTGTSDKTVNTEKDSFKVEFVVDIADLEKVGAGGISDLWAWLAPAGKTGDDDDRASDIVLRDDAGYRSEVRRW